MPDHKILALAAKAIAKINWQSTSRYADAKCDSEGVPYWNPLKDDGDALRLAVKLHIIVGMYETYANGCAIGHDADISVYLHEVNDSCEAMRRAIVLVAAEIGSELI